MCPRPIRPTPRPPRRRLRRRSRRPHRVAARLRPLLGLGPGLVATVRVKAAGRRRRIASCCSRRRSTWRARRRSSPSMRVSAACATRRMDAGSFATVAKRAEGGRPARQDLTAWNLTTPQPTMHVLKANVDTRDPLTLPGEIMTDVQRQRRHLGARVERQRRRVPRRRRLQGGLQAASVRRSRHDRRWQDARACSKARPRRSTSRLPRSTRISRG